MFPLTYLIYILTWEALVIGGCAYLVFWRGANSEWFWLAVLLSFCSYSPKKWRSLFNPE